MIKFEKTQVQGFEPAIRGMRNSWESWDKSDSKFYKHFVDRSNPTTIGCVELGPNDLDLAMRLRSAGTSDRKFLRMIVAWVDITAPLYWWKEFDTYKIGTVANSTSTMRKLMSRPLTISDFSIDDDLINEDLFNGQALSPLNEIIDVYKNFDKYKAEGALKEETTKEDAFKAAIQLLPESFNQKRTVMLNYEVLANIYQARKNHRLDEWRVDFMDWIRSLPYLKLITGEEE